MSVQWKDEVQWREAMHVGALEIMETYLFVVSGTPVDA